MNKKIVVTGGTGFIGSHLIGEMISNGYDVILLKRSFSDLERIKDYLDRIKLYNIDRVSIREVFKNERNIFATVHLATLYRKFHKSDDISEMILSNIAFPIELLEISREFGVKAFLNTGTFFEYDCTSNPVSESAEIRAFNFYAKNKLAFEGILRTYSDEMKCVTFKLFSPYGPKDYSNKIVPYIIDNAVRTKTIYLSHGLQKLDFVYVEDIVKAYLNYLKYESNIGNEYITINIGSGICTSIRDFVSVTEEILGSRINVEWGEVSENIDIVYANIQKAHELIQWKPETTLHEGVKKTINFYKEKYES